jgi:hypothetical protein
MAGEKVANRNLMWAGEGKTRPLASSKNAHDRVQASVDFPLHEVWLNHCFYQQKAFDFKTLHQGLKPALHLIATLNIPPLSSTELNL